MLSFDKIIEIPILKVQLYKKPNKLNETSNLEAKDRVEDSQIQLLKKRYAYVEN